MRYIVLSALLFLLAAPTPARAQGLDDFSRFSKAINKQIALVEADGTVREGILTAATADGVTVRFPSGEKTFPRATVASAERTHDGKVDGAIKGAVLAALMSAVMWNDWNGNNKAGWFAGQIATFAGVGWLIDAGQTNSEPIYLAPPPVTAVPTGSLKLSFRF